MRRWRASTFVHDASRSAGRLRRYVAGSSKTSWTRFTVSNGRGQSLQLCPPIWGRAADTWGITTDSHHGRSNAPVSPSARCCSFGLMGCGGSSGGQSEGLEAPSPATPTETTPSPTTGTGNDAFGERSATVTLDLTDSNGYTRRRHIPLRDHLVAFKSSDQVVPLFSIRHAHGEALLSEPRSLSRSQATIQRNPQHRQCIGTCHRGRQRRTICVPIRVTRNPQQGFENLQQTRRPWEPRRR